MKIAIGSDHAGFKLKQELLSYLGTLNIEVKDYGCHSEERADYPDFAHLVASDVESKKSDFGILICGSGNGINMAANKHKGIRSALCWNKEIAILARNHNNANVLALPGRYISTEEAINCVQAFITEKFEGGRHQDRINKIPAAC